MRMKLIPSEEGSGVLLQKGTTLKRIQLAAGDTPLGLLLPRYDPAAIRKLIQRGYVQTLELESADFLESRSQIQDLCKSVGTAAIFAAFTRDIGREITKLSYPKHNAPGGDGDNSTVTVLRSLMAGVKDGKRSRIETAAELLKSLPLGQKRRIHGLVRADGTGSVLKTFRQLLKRFADRGDIPEYLALVVLELVNNLQIQTMHDFALRTGVSDDTIRDLFQNPSVRARIREKMELQGATNAITWNFTNTEGEGSRTTRMSITMTGAGSPMRATTAGVRQQKKINVGERSLKDFYEEMADTGVGIDLGLHYLSFLEELCHNAGIRFETRAREISSGEKTMVGIRLYI
jgi:hypothetical protein